MLLSAFSLSCLLCLFSGLGPGLEDSALFSVLPSVPPYLCLPGAWVGDLTSLLGPAHWLDTWKSDRFVRGTGWLQ